MGARWGGVVLCTDGVNSREGGRNGTPWRTVCRTAGSIRTEIFMKIIATRLINDTLCLI